jgi:cob(I)alamin adenosyltransferase
MYNRRVSKTHPRVEACGAVDELNSVLGLARSASALAKTRELLVPIQKELVGLMGELATLSEDAQRYKTDGYACICGEAVSRLEEIIRGLEAQKISYQGWATPGATPASAALDVARSVGRRAERAICALKESGELPNQMILIYLNRLSDLLWLLARQAEGNPPTEIMA